MQLTDADKKRITDWLSAKCGQMRCTCCGNARWELLPGATLPIGIDLRSTRFFYSQGVPQVAIVCVTCSHMVFFSPGVMGINPDEPPPASTPNMPATADKNPQ